jgi:hypothetical protein
MKRVLLINVLLTFSSLSLAGGLLNSAFQTQSTSDEISLSTLSLNYNSNKRDLFDPYKEESDYAIDLLFDFDYNTGVKGKSSYEGFLLKSGIGLKASPGLYGRLSLGVDGLQSQIRTTQTLASTAQLFSRWRSELFVAEHTYGFIFRELTQERDLDLTLKAHTTSLT